MQYGATNDIAGVRAISAALRQSMQAWDGLLELLPIAVYVCDARGVIVQYNRRAAELWGRAPSVGDTTERFCDTHKLFFDGILTGRDETPMARVLRTGEPVHGVEGVLERPDGSRTWAMVHIDPLRDENGALVGAINCFHETTGQKRVEERLREQDQRLAATYEHATVGISECDAEGNLLRVNEASCALTGYTREELLNRGPFFRQMRPEDVEAERDLFRRQAEGEVDRYTIEKQIRRKDGTEISVSVMSSSVRDEEGRFRYAVRVLQDITERKRAEARLRASERRLRELLEAVPAAIYTTDAEGRITFYNQAAVDFSGRTPTLGSDEWCVTWKLYWPDGTPMPHDECPMAVALKEGRAIRDAEAIAERPDGTRVPFIPYPTPLFNETGKLTGAINMLVDISDRKTAELSQKTLIDELNHRVKNTLATVQSLARQTARNATEPKLFQERLQGRLIALSHAHDQLTRGNWEQADLREILRASLSPYDEGAAERVLLEGEPIQLTPRAALTLAMVFHELITNAGKYGALSQPSGRLDVSWRAEDKDDIRVVLITWHESGGPAVKPPEQRGFGTQMVERSVPAELGGTAVLRFDAAGVRCDLAFPLARIGEQESRSAQRSAGIRR